MHGILLRHYGYNVRILEQNTSLERADLAAGITTHPEFEEFMKRFDTTGKPWSIQSPGIQFLNKDASVKRRINKALQMTSWGVLYSHLRTSFDETRYLQSDDDANGHSTVKRVDDSTFEGGKRVTGMSHVGKELEITYDNLLKGGEKESARVRI
jgi:2-polyprenyl-6-methoxyphenol hydroxylase-like FAD-dependent oxidoreductase